MRHQINPGGIMNEVGWSLKIERPDKQACGWNVVADFQQMKEVEELVVEGGVVERSI